MHGNGLGFLKVVEHVHQVFDNNIALPDKIVFDVWKHVCVRESVNLAPDSRPASRLRSASLNASETARFLGSMQDTIQNPGME